MNLPIRLLQQKSCIREILLLLFVETYCFPTVKLETRVHMEIVFWPVLSVVMWIPFA